MTELEKAYLAGLVEADGCFYLGMTTSKKKDNSYKYKFSARIDISSCSEDLMKWLSNLIGVGHRKVETISRRPNALIYRWVMYNQKDVSRFINAVRPYLVHKQKEADLLLEFIEIRGQFPNVRDEKGRLIGRHSPREIEIYRELKALHKAKYKEPRRRTTK